LRDLGQAAQGELPFILQVPLLEAAQLADEAEAVGAAGVSLGAPRGSLPSPTGRLINGRLYGPSLFPIVLEAVSEINTLGIPIIAGGVSSSREVAALQEAGAGAIQLDYVIWQPGGLRNLLDRISSE
jgi:dihydroorotate dehydrogenase (NAD+) catalytic subunit